MNAREILKTLTPGAKFAFVLIAVLTHLARILTLVTALITDIGEQLVAAGEVGATAVVAAGTMQAPPTPTGYRTRDMAAWSTP
ncbi:hypothetical protein [Kutzneria sp. NPDC051319]|uniref:hypothetical protein n=1 Tax=Kutzneria sp. NPDC051319 TaxID=3155047 RepID=UPI00343F4D5C